MRNQQGRIAESCIYHCCSSSPAAATGGATLSSMCKRPSADVRGTAYSPPGIFVPSYTWLLIRLGKPPACQLSRQDSNIAIDVWNTPQSGNQIVLLSSMARAKRRVRVLLRSRSPVDRPT